MHRERISAVLGVVYESMSLYESFPCVYNVSVVCRLCVYNVCVMCVWGICVAMCDFHVAVARIRTDNSKINTY